jgi:hypothetical protein
MIGRPGAGESRALVYLAVLAYGTHLLGAFEAKGSRPHLDIEPCLISQ